MTIAYRRLSDLCADMDAKSHITASGCWEWTSTRSPDGYGKVVVGYRGHGRPVRRFAHRVLYELARGPVPKGLELDHLCRNRACCNPAHLEPVTRRENVRRGLLPAMLREKAAAQAHCKRGGHPLSGDNLVLQGPEKKFRVCRICRNERQRQRHNRKKEQ